MALPLLTVPLILKAATFTFGFIGLSAGVAGGAAGVEAHLTMKEIKERHKQNMTKFESQQKTTAEDMDKLGILELEVLKTFEEFSDTMEKIQNRPEFSDKRYTDLDLPQYHPEKLKEISVGASMLLSGIGAATLGTAGGFAAAGATKAVVIALGTASTGTALSSLSGAALTNATLAALGGGAKAAGGGGMLLGTTLLNGAAIGAGLLAGGIVIAVAGFTLSSKSEEARIEMLEIEAHIEEVCTHLKTLSGCSLEYLKILQKITDIYREKLGKMDLLINQQGVRNWDDFSKEDQLNVENTVLLVGMLHKMCQVQLVLPPSETDLSQVSRVNLRDLGEVTSQGEHLLMSVH